MLALLRLLPVHAEGLLIQGDIGLFLDLLAGEVQKISGLPLERKPADLQTGPLESL